MNGEQRRRIREFGLQLGLRQPGRLNAITDVQGVKVGHSTLIKGEGSLDIGRGPVRTGVTVVLPHGNNIYANKVRAGLCILNGAGEVAGRSQVEELGYVETPIAITNTLSVPQVSDAIIDYTAIHSPDMGVCDNTAIPLVLECDDGWLNDIRGRHVNKESVLEAIENSTSGVVDEGAIGAGTGLISFGFKGGIGTSSRSLTIPGNTVTIGVLVATNVGRREQLTIQGLPVGAKITDLQPILNNVWKRVSDSGSVVAVIATDASVSERQLRRMATRATFGCGRTGVISMHGSGDVFVAFSTMNLVSHSKPGELIQSCFISDEDLDELFLGIVEAVEEAILNSLTMAVTIIGRDGNCAFKLPLDRLEHILNN